MSRKTATRKAKNAPPPMTTQSHTRGFLPFGAGGCASCGGCGAHCTGGANCGGGWGGGEEGGGGGWSGSIRSASVAPAVGCGYPPALPCLGRLEVRLELNLDPAGLTPVESLVGL